MIGNLSFRTTGITDYLKNGGTLENVTLNKHQIGDGSS